MPHPSYPVDDTSVRSYNREPWLPSGSLEDVWIVVFVSLRGGRKCEPASRTYV
ncbi:hypothetical protein GY45DRAFT_1320426 [Cubamyces sp. BRFM 1775]|nr:hypothetical protein GY45DRAFT_1320426 [Cubamyces sp. BRFM 1775]